MMLKAEKPPSLDRNFSGKETIHKHSDKPRHPGNIIGILRKMIETTRPDSVQNSAIKNSAINYLCIIADHEDIHQAMIGVGIIELLLLCLESTDVDIRALNSVLEKIASCELLRSEIMKNGKILAEMLSSQDPVKLLRVAATLDSLSSHGEIRQIVQEMPEYKNLAEDALHYLYPHHHPHEHDLYTSASQAIKSIIWAFNAYNTKEKGRAYTK
ncbi:hypothetical protein EV702DRAFT_1140715 [Suillus placidus]|uniref:Uncharacterized protein n=1 Tax=Suillus placidus TaxID=48579 RepID=A0A9P6ZHA9_9AGAM|nr:hypothetical protein EV702DRAFT_1153437 [Suillus placidus]KAG1765052.1 hypothetical protein EV702DRAFT_1153022 [Suillus placidus]KAG1769920.1 hypothetical protein EV702DRAFT_1140715 [Suillus placidus]